MAKATVHSNSTPTVRLELSVDETRWLRSLLQNPIGMLQDPPSDYEDERECRIRTGIFEALPNESTNLDPASFFA